MAKTRQFVCLPKLFFNNQDEELYSHMYLIINNGISYINEKYGENTVYSRCLLYLVVLGVSCYCTCLFLYGYFVMVPLNFTLFATFFFEQLFNLFIYSTKYNWKKIPILPSFTLLWLPETHRLFFGLMEN